MYGVCLGILVERTDELAPRAASRCSWRTRFFVFVLRRERNREHAKRSRVRKKFLLESLQKSVTALQEENEKLRGAIRANLGADEAKELLAQTEASSLIASSPGDATKVRPQKGSWIFICDNEAFCASGGWCGGRVAVKVFDLSDFFFFGHQNGCLGLVVLRSRFYFSLLLCFSAGLPGGVVGILGAYRAEEPEFESRYVRFVF